MPENSPGYEKQIDMGKDYFTQNNLLDMGWTQSLIKRLLPKPFYGRNPVYASGYKMKLFPKTVVLKAMETSEYKEFSKRSQKVASDTSLT